MPRSGRPNTLSRGMPKVLVIDDDDAFRSTLAVTLGKHGFQVHEATGGAKGVQLARDLHPDLILCDVNMDGADGRLTLYALRRDPAIASIPFFLMSGNSLSGEALPGTGRGADGFLLKPFTAEKLFTTIESCLAKVQPPSDGIPPAAALNNETRITSLQQALLQPLEQIIDVVRRISTTDLQKAPAEVKRLVKQAHRSALRLKKLIEEQTDPRSEFQTASKHRTERAVSSLDGVVKVLDAP
jgi:two-component system, sensor histidine kinase and response regulator